MSSRRWMVLGDGAGLGLATGFYVWMIGGPRPADPAIFQTAQPGLLAGLPSILAVALPAGVLLAGLFGAWPGTRVWLGRLALASCGLYLASVTAVVGSGAQTAAAAAALVALVVLFVRDDSPAGGAVLLTLHAGAFGTAIAFFEQWATYRAGWAPLLEQLPAMTTIWLGA